MNTLIITGISAAALLLTLAVLSVFAGGRASRTIDGILKREYEKRQQECEGKAQS